MAYEDFNDYIDELGENERLQGYDTLQNFYFLHQALIKGFKGIDNQFKIWLNKESYISKNFITILNELPNYIDLLSDIKFELSDLESLDGDLTLAKLVRYIKNEMTLSEIKNNANKFKELSTKYSSNLQEENHNKKTFNTYANELKKQVILNKKIFNYFLGVDKQINTMLSLHGMEDNILQFINQMPQLIQKLSSFKSEIEEHPQINYLSPEATDFLSFIKNDMILIEIDNSIQRWHKIANNHQYFLDFYWTPVYEKTQSYNCIVNKMYQYHNNSINHHLQRLEIFPLIEDTIMNFNEELIFIHDELPQKQVYYDKKVDEFNRKLNVLINEAINKRNENTHYSRDAQLERSFFDELFDRDVKLQSFFLEKVNYYNNEINRLSSFKISHDPGALHRLRGQLTFPVTEEKLNEIKELANHLENELQMKLNVKI